jgi:hypothetical protein
MNIGAILVWVILIGGCIFFVFWIVRSARQGGADPETPSEEIPETEEERIERLKRIAGEAGKVGVNVYRPAKGDKPKD